MSRYPLTAIAATGLLSLLASGSAASQGLSSGLYFHTEMGANYAPSLTMYSSSTDGGSVCDPFINPAAASTPGCPTQGSGWSSSFDPTSGVFASMAVGFSFESLQTAALLQGVGIELSYVFRSSGYDQTAPILGRGGIARDKLSNEVAQATERVSNLASSSAFLSVRYGFLRAKRLTPYLGIGAGISRTELDTSRIWAREFDPQAITTGADLPNGDVVRNNLAGTVSVAQTTSNSALTAVQFLAGIEYAVTSSFSLGLAGRYVRPGDYATEDRLDLLRSHDPPAGYVRELETSRLSFLTFGVTTRYTIGS